MKLLQYGVDLLFYIAMKSELGQLQMSIQCSLLRRQVTICCF